MTEERLISGRAAIHYVTTRQAHQDEYVMYGSERERNSGFHYGSIELELPSSMTTQKNPSLLGNWFNEGKPKQYQLEHLTHEQYRRDLSVLEGDTLVYIHGYNTSFRAAAASLEQWVSATGFSGKVFLFSWPSKDSFADYGADRESAVWSAKVLSEFLHDLLLNPNHRLHVLAHSMGSVALTSALQFLQSQLVRVIDNIILAAPDLDAELFVDVLWPSLNNMAKNWSVYHSNNDLALMASRKVNTHPRLGAQALDINGIEFVDVSSLEFDYRDVLASHAYHERSACVTRDINALIQGESANSRRVVREEAFANG